MHKINVLALGSDSFNTSLKELKDYLNFNLDLKNHKNQNFNDYDIILFHEDYLDITNHKKYFSGAKNTIKILVSKSKNSLPNFFS